MGELLAPIGNLFHVLFFQPIYNIMMLIYQGTHSYALSIIILTLLIRSALIPLTRKQLKSSRAMQVLAPQLKELQAKYRSDPQRLMAEQQRLYKENGVSPLSGCLPLLFQMPFLYALYFSFNTVSTALGAANLSYASRLGELNNSIYPFLPKLTRLPDPQFLWTNLAHPDPLYILPVLAGILTFIQLRMAMPVRSKQAAAQQDPTTQAANTTMYLMPFITTFFGLQFPSGLALYWTIGTLFSAVQQYFIAGWGSLATLPGFNKILPPPVIAPAPAVVAPAVSGAGRRVAAVVPTAAPEAGGLRGLLRQLRENAMAAAAPPAETASRGDATPSEQVVERAPRPAQPSSAANARPRKKDPARHGPMLVKPASEDPVARAIAEGTDTTVLPEQEVQRQNGNGTAPSSPATNGNHAARPGPTTRRPGPRGSANTRGRGGSRGKGGR